jgi:hypothetical protein
MSKSSSIYTVNNGNCMDINNCPECVKANTIEKTIVDEPIIDDPVIDGYECMKNTDLCFANKNSHTGYVMATKNIRMFPHQNKHYEYEPVIIPKGTVCWASGFWHDKLSDNAILTSLSHKAKTKKFANIISRKKYTDRIIVIPNNGYYECKEKSFKKCSCVIAPTLYPTKEISLNIG